MWVREFDREERARVKKNSQTPICIILSLSSAQAVCPPPLCHLPGGSEGCCQVHAPLWTYAGGGWLYWWREGDWCAQENHRCEEETTCGWFPTSYYWLWVVVEERAGDEWQEWMSQNLHNSRRRTKASNRAQATAEYTHPVPSACQQPHLHFNMQHTDQVHGEIPHQIANVWMLRVLTNTESVPPTQLHYRAGDRQKGNMAFRWGHRARNPALSNQGNRECAVDGWRGEWATPILCAEEKPRNPLAWHRKPNITQATSKYIYFLSE